METLIVSTLDDDVYDGGDLAAELADGGGLSLREALGLAQDGDTITFDDAIDGGIITLAQGQLTITQDDLIIDGDLDDDGFADITIDANDQSRVLEVSSGTQADANDVQIDGLQITGGYLYGANEYGAGILVNNDADLTIINSLITQNDAVGPFGLGGGIFLNGDRTRLEVSNSSISENSASAVGGGIGADSPGAEIIISSTQFDLNIAGVGGGIFNYGSTTIDEGSSFTANTAFDGSGGGAFLGGETTISDTEFSTNFARTGGGAVHIDALNENVEITNSVFVANSAVSFGGGIFANSGNSLSVSNSTFYANSALSGGAIYNQGARLFLDSSTFTGNTADRGAAIHFSDGVYAANTIFSGNESAAGSDIYDAGANFVSFGGNIFSDLGLGGTGDTYAPDPATVFNEVVVNPYTNVIGGRLRDNGGAVPTVMINPDGPAHNGGDERVLRRDTLDLDGDMDTAERLPIDARGSSRVEGVLDSGAVELKITNGDNDANTLVGTEFSETINGLTRSDTIFGDSGHDTLDGGGAADSIEGGDGDDSLIGGLGADTLRGEGGHDTIIGGGGKDWVIGREGDDFITGGKDDDRLFGGDGDDTIDGGARNDSRVSGQGGDDLLFGGTGTDSLFGGDDNDTLDGGGGNDLADGGSGNDSILGGVGHDLLRGGDDNDTLDGGNGKDTVVGGDGDDSLIGGKAEDNLSGDDGNDTLEGGNRDDTLFGNDGDDVLDGGNQNDQLHGGDGNDILTGGIGDDKFHFALGDDADQITDFTAGAGSEDVIEISGFGPAFDSFAEVLAATADDGNGNAVIDFGGGDTITLTGVDVGSLHADDFVFG